MPEREHSSSRQEDQARAPRRSEDTPTAPATAILRWQRLVGNRAVTEMVTREDGEGATAAPPASWVVEAGLPAALEADLGAVSAAAAREAVRLKWGKLNSGKKRLAEEVAIQRMRAWLGGAKGGDLEPWLIAQGQKGAPPAPKEPFGDAKDRLPGLRERAERFKTDMTAWLDTEPGMIHAERLLKHALPDIKGPLERMLIGADEAKAARVEGFENNLKGYEAEFERAKAAPKGTEFGANIVGKDGRKFEIDQIAPDRKTWVNIKKYRPDKVHTQLPELTAQALKNLEAAGLARNLVEGEPPKIVFDFVDGIDSETATQFEATEHDGRRPEAHVQGERWNAGLPEGR
jgi:hypothetical protein